MQFEQVEYSSNEEWGTSNKSSKYSNERGLVVCFHKKVVELCMQEVGYNLVLRIYCFHIGILFSEVGLDLRSASILEEWSSAYEVELCTHTCLELSCGMSLWQDLINGGAVHAWSGFHMIPCWSFHVLLHFFFGCWSLRSAQVGRVLDLEEWSCVSSPMYCSTKLN